MLPMKGRFWAAPIEGRPCDREHTLDQQSSGRPSSWPRWTASAGYARQCRWQRPDNRQRGNAAQLLEKYKSLARDAQLAGDRVQTEYYLQYADHYFRVLEDSRSRFEEQQGQRRPRRDDDEDEDEGNEEMCGRSPRTATTTARPRCSSAPAAIVSAAASASNARIAPVRTVRVKRAPMAPRRDEEGEGEERISLGVLPPAIGASEDEAEAEAPKPRRRAPRKPRAEDDGDDIAPAA